MIEAGRKFWNRLRRGNEQPVNPHGSVASEIISSAIDSSYIEGYSSDLPNVIVYIGRERIGREVVSFENQSDGKKHPYFVYFFDVLDPDNPRRRIGLKANQTRIQTYYAPTLGTYNQFIDTNTLDEEDLMLRLKQMSSRLESFRNPSKVDPKK